MLKLIKTTVLDASAASVTIDNIPQQFKTLQLMVSARTNRANDGDYLNLSLNGGSDTGYTFRTVQGDGTSASSVNGTSYFRGVLTDAANNTASTFSSGEITVPNYSGSTNKAVSVSHVYENNATSAQQILTAYLWSNTAAITSIVLSPVYGTSIVAGSTFYLYGIG